jgi:hypothetical protein
MKKTSLNPKAILAAIAVGAFALYGQASAQNLTSSIVQGISTTTTIPVSVNGYSDYAIFNSVNASETQQIATEGSADSFTNAVLSNAGQTIGTNDAGPGTGSPNFVLNPITGPYTFTYGTSTTSATAASTAPGGGSAQFGAENNKLTFSQAVLASNETLTLYSNGKYINQTFTATLTSSTGTVLAVTSVGTTDGTASGAPNDGNLAAESTFVLTGAAVGDTLTFVETESIPTSGRFYAQPSIDAITVLATNTPEPSTYGLMGLGFVALLGMFKFRKLNA